LKIFSLGMLGSDPEKDFYKPNDLKQAALFGHYNKVVDILDHWSEITPNSRCEVTCTLTTATHCAAGILYMVLCCATGHR
jgi:hypothetical protein